MRNTYLAILTLLILVGVALVNFLSFKENGSSVLHDQTASLSSLMPKKSDVPIGTMAELSPLFAQNVPNSVHPVAATPQVTPLTSPPLAQTPTSFPPPPQQPADTGLPVAGTSTTGTPVSYIYFFTGMPVRTVPMTTVVYTTGTVPMKPVSAIPVPTVPMMPQMPPFVQRYAVPIFVPQIVPSRVGAPKLVYSNGVVIKPKVYFPHQPLRNAIRGITP